MEYLPGSSERCHNEAVRPLVLTVGLVLSATALGEPVRTVFQRGTHGTVLDCYVWQSSPDSNGNSDTLYVGLVGAGEKWTFMRFDVSELAGQKVLDARLLLQTSSGGQLIRAHEAAQAWAETEPTWRTFSTAFRPGVVASFTPVSGRTVVDLTAVVQAWALGAPNHGLVFEQDPGGAATTFDSSDSPTASLRPALEVLVEGSPLLATAPPALTAACGTPLRYSLRAAAPDATAFAILDAPEGMSLDESTGELSWTPLRTDRGDRSFRAKVSDGARFATFDVALAVECNPPLDVGCTAAPGGALTLVGLLLLRRRR